MTGMRVYVADMSYKMDSLQSQLQALRKENHQLQKVAEKKHDLMLHVVFESYELTWNQSSAAGILQTTEACGSHRSRCDLSLCAVHRCGAVSEAMCGVSNAEPTAQEFKITIRLDDAENLPTSVHSLASAFRSESSMLFKTALKHYGIVSLRRTRQMVVASC